MKLLGWILLILGVVGIWLGFISSYGVTTGVVSIVVALIGLWLVMKKDNAPQM